MSALYWELPILLVCVPLCVLVFWDLWRLERRIDDAFYQARLKQRLKRATEDEAWANRDALIDTVWEAWDEQPRLEVVR